MRRLIQRTVRPIESAARTANEFKAPEVCLIGNGMSQQKGLCFMISAGEEEGGGGVRNHSWPRTSIGR